MAQSRFYLYTFGLKVGTFYILGALGHLGLSLQDVIRHYPISDQVMGTREPEQILACDGT